MEMDMIRLKFNFATVVRLLREQKGLKQNELGVNHVTVSQMELGNRNPEPETMQKIAQHLGTTVEEINAMVDRLNGLSGRNPAESNGDSPHSRLHQLLDEVMSSNRKGAEILRHNVSSSLISAVANIYSRPLDYELWEELFPKRNQERK